MGNKKEKMGEGVKFQRIRRITGYLTGDLTTWNDAKKAEEKDRVKHGIGGKMHAESESQNAKIVVLRFVELWKIATTAPTAVQRWTEKGMRHNNGC